MISSVNPKYVPHNAKFGDVTHHGNPATSKVEELVRGAVVAAGYKVPGHKVAVLCRHPHRPEQLMPLAPDIALVDHKIDIEVDPCAEDPSGRWSTHRGDEERDLSRNALMEEAGWTVLRLRLGAEEGMHIGPRDVIVESSSLTKAALAALLQALEDELSGRPPKVRVVKKGKRPAAPQRRSHVVKIGEFRYADNGHIFSWYPDLDSPDFQRLRLCVGGRYLCTHTKPPLIIAEAGLQELPRTQWKEKLTALLKDLGPSPEAREKWPWGPSLLIQHDVRAEELVESCEYRASLDHAGFYFTFSGLLVGRWDDSELRTRDDEPLASLHPDAVTLGYRVEQVESLAGWSGYYQKVSIARVSQP